MIATQTAQAPTATPPLISAEVVAEFDDLLDKLVEQDLFTGSVLLAYQGNVLISQGYGLADREQNIPNTAQTRYRIASMTKQFTAMAILILASHGKLDVQDPICKYLDDCPPTWETITIHHLLTHTSGLIDCITIPGYQGLVSTPTAPLQIISLVKDSPLDFQPGEKFSYNQTGYILLGIIIERVSGQSYENFLQQSIFTPVGMQDSGFDHNAQGVAVGYAQMSSSSPASFVDLTFISSTGALYSTVEDLYRWSQALSTEKLVPQAYLDKMFTPYVVNQDDGSEYGYGTMISTSHDRPINGHYGGISGFRSVFARYPDDQITFIILSNWEGQNVDFFLSWLGDKIFGEN